MLSQQVREVNGRVTLQLPLSAREILRADETDNIYYQVVGKRGEYVAGDHDLPLPSEEDQGHAGLVSLRDDRVAGNDVRVAYTYVDPKSAGSQPVLVQVAETLDKRARLANEIIKGVILPQFVILPLAVVLVWFGLTRGAGAADRDPAAHPGAQPPAIRAPSTRPPRRRRSRRWWRRSMTCWRGWTKSVQTQKRFIADAAHQMQDAAGRAAHAGRAGAARASPSRSCAARWRRSPAVPNARRIW